MFVVLFNFFKLNYKFLSWEKNIQLYFELQSVIIEDKTY